MTEEWLTPIADEYAGEVLRWYEGLEAQVIDFIHLVPPHRTNLEVWSSKIATVLVEACCLIESIFYHFRDDAATVQRLKKPGDRVTLKHYAPMYSSLLRLPDRTAILLTDIPEYRRPFTRWTDLAEVPFDGTKHTPRWWNLYNRSKHGRIAAFSEFTLTMAIDALAGALIVIATVPAFAPALVRHEWLPMDGWNPEALLECYLSVLFRGEKSPRSQDFTVERPLLAIPILSHRKLPDDIKEFRPVLYGASPRLLRWFRKF